MENLNDQLVIEYSSNWDSEAAKNWQNPTGSQIRDRHIKLSFARKLEWIKNYPLATEKMMGKTLLIRQTLDGNLQYEVRLHRAANNPDTVSFDDPIYSIEVAFADDNYSSVLRDNQAMTLEDLEPLLYTIIRGKIAEVLGE